MAPPDAIIVGGGIQGASMALAMARRGLRPLLVERHRPGAGASGNSYGIVHGGLRYLQGLDVPRWRHSRRAQGWFLRELPGLVRPLPCVMPLYRGRLRSPALFRAAMAAERALVATLGPRLPLPPAACLPPAAVMPGLDLPRGGLTGAALWHDVGIPDSAALLAALLDRAGVRGDRLLSDHAARGLVLRGGRVAALRVAAEDGTETEIETPVVIDCAGSWSSRWHGGRPPASAACLAWNLLLDLPEVDGALGDRALAVSPVPGQGRSIFLKRHAGGVLAGTWYRPAPGMTEPEPGEADIAASLAELSRALPGLRVPRGAVRRVLAGLLPDTDGTGRALSPRDHLDAPGPAGLHAVLGGKLTTAPLLSERLATRIWGPRRADGGLPRGTEAALRA